MQESAERERRKRERLIYNEYQKAQLGSGYLLIGYVSESKRKNGKQVICAIPEPARVDMEIN